MYWLKKTNHSYSVTKQRHIKLDAEWCKYALSPMTHKFQMEWQMDWHQLDVRTSSGTLMTKFGNCILMALCKTAVTPLLLHWSYCSLALSHRYMHICIWDEQNIHEMFTLHAYMCLWQQIKYQWNVYNICIYVYMGTKKIWIRYQCKVYRDDVVGPCLTKCDTNITYNAAVSLSANGSTAFIWKPCCHWLKDLQQPQTI